LIEAIVDEVSASGVTRPGKQDIEKGLKGARYVLLVDALDEIADADRRSQVLSLLKGIAAASLFPNMRVVLTTRTARYTGNLKFGPEFETVEVAPLKQEQVRELCLNWSRYRQRDEQYQSSLASAVAGLADQVGASSEDQALTENPLMLTAICMVFERYRSLPDDRGRWCDLLIDDLCRSRHSEDVEHGWRLDDAAKKDLLQRIALGMQQEGVQAWPVSRAIQIALSTVPATEELRQQRAKRYLDWTADHTGLLRFQQANDGEEQIRFWHRLFREYLCANRLAQLDNTAALKPSLQLG
jgi:predicted NACHT family NTPase